MNISCDYYYGYILQIKYKDGYEILQEISRDMGYLNVTDVEIDDFESYDQMKQHVYLTMYEMQMVKHSDKIIYLDDQWKIRNKDSIEKYSILAMNYPGQIDIMVKKFFIVK